MGDLGAPGAAPTTEARSPAEIAADAAKARCPECSIRPGGLWCAEGELHASRIHQALLDRRITEAEFRALVGSGGLVLRLISIP